MTSTMQHHPQNEKGFTVFETAIALVVMTVVGLAAAGGFVYAIRYNAGAADRNGSMSIAQTAMEKLRAVPFYDSALNAAVTNTTVNMTDTNNNVIRSYSVTTTIADKVIVSGKTTIKSITIEVAPLNATGTGTLNQSNLDFYGSVKLYTERCNPSMGTNIH
jgi:Tfp pilus assembly protein PilV